MTETSFEPRTPPQRAPMEEPRVTRSSKGVVGPAELKSTSTKRIDELLSREGGERVRDELSQANSPLPNRFVLHHHPKEPARDLGEERTCERLTIQPDRKRSGCMSSSREKRLALPLTCQHGRSHSKREKRDIYSLLTDRSTLCLTWRVPGTCLNHQMRRSGIA